jgi:uncharacterized repeat protein (TIGR01451 family)
MLMKVLSGRKVFTFILLLTGVFFLSGVSFAQSGEPKLELKTAAEKEVKVKKDGKVETKRIPVEKANPGDVVVYTITYSNTGKGSLVDAVIINPVPQGVVYMLDSAEGKDAEIKASIDNGRSWQKPPATVLMKNADGTETAKPAGAERYTHLQWTVKKPLAPGQSGRVSFKVNVK